MKGWVYVITNKAMPGLIKVGFSMKDPELRAAELNHTGSPHPYAVDYEVLVDEPRDVEQTVHGRLRNHREGKEWFRCTTEEAIISIKGVVGTKMQVENFKRADRAKVEAIKRQRDAEERSRRAAEEGEERARRAAEEDRRKRISALNDRRQEIISRYEPSLKAALPCTNFWAYFAGVFLALGMLLAVFFSKINAEIFMWWTIGSFVITPFVKGDSEEKAKESAQYKSILSKRDAELAVIDSEKAKLR